MKYRRYSGDREVVYNFKILLGVFVFTGLLIFIGINLYNELNPITALDNPKMISEKEEDKKAIENDVSEEVKNKITQTDKQSNQQAKTDNATVLSIKGIDGASNSAIQVANIYCSYIPSTLASRLNYENWVVYVSGKEITSRYTGSVQGSIAGFTDYDKNEIYVRGNESSIRYALLHEIGHVLDKDAGFVSKSDDWEKIYEDEKDKLDVYSYDGYYKTTPQEYFAEVFSESLINPSRCKHSAPRSYNFIKKGIESWLR